MVDDTYQSVMDRLEMASEKELLSWYRARKPEKALAELLYGELEADAENDASYLAVIMGMPYPGEER